MPKHVLIVESGAKTKTLQGHLGPDWAVLATGGHVETLPWDRQIHGKDATKAYWANRPGRLPDAPWTWTERGKDAVDRILEAANDEAPVFWLAPDPDREGEFIAWSLDRHLSNKGLTHRVTFQEITAEAVHEAIKNPGPVDQEMVDGAIVRKLLDRMVGFRTSTMASAIVGRGASMGRVQTPTLGFVVDRELEREAHVPIRYFEVHARAASVQFDVRFAEPSDDDVWRDDAGKANASRTSDGDAAHAALRALHVVGLVEITSVKESTQTRKSSPPLTTDAVLQAAGSRFGWTPKKTSALASMLYEAGHITYIRTDSTRLAAAATHASDDPASPNPELVEDATKRRPWFCHACSTSSKFEWDCRGSAL
jgi:DNA topoisomerase I